MSLVFFYNIKKKCFIFVLGLCGNFDDNKENDRMMSDGTLYTGTSKRPVQFSKSWRFVVLWLFWHHPQVNRLQNWNISRLKNDIIIPLIQLDFWTDIQKVLFGLFFSLYSVKKIYNPCSVYIKIIFIHINISTVTSIFIKAINAYIYNKKIKKTLLHTCIIMFTYFLYHLFIFSLAIDTKGCQKLCHE
jgi:hypothetical protein